MCKIDVSAGCATGRADGEAEKNGPCRESHPVTTDFEAEVGALTRMIEADPTDARYYCERGCLREQIGDLEGALADYARCIELDPENPVGHCLRGAAQERRRPPGQWHPQPPGQGSHAARGTLDVLDPRR